VGVPRKFPDEIISDTLVELTAPAGDSLPEVASEDSNELNPYKACSERSTFFESRDKVFDEADGVFDDSDPLNS
jgi:hypothetical protein